MTDGTWLDEAKKNSGFLIFLGVMTIIFGVLAVGAPLITGITVAVMVGFLLLFMGIARIVHAFKSGQWGTGIWGTIIGLLAVIAGLMTIFRPMAGLMSLTLFLAAYFLVDGVCEIIAAFKIKPDQGWGWLLFNGIIAVLLGAMIWRQWPVSGAWAIGILVGVHILMSGWSMVILGTGARRFAGAIEDAVGDTVDKADSVVDRAVDAVDDAVDKADDMVDDVMDKAEDVVDSVVDKAKDAAEATGDAVGDVVEKAKDLVDRDKD
jgi:uncharacterized membrane protein HdeD (DUF308 family)/ElaB/YqjD/DUF883 family membrane-anchored ribosome-binding protein